ncbi:hypothetical protein QR685DRAFT_527620 [Neurospora intermedia]|uniref:Uncharacterized protein n=1 Tax=Neurospora intermedia TaxID=5142 RepID=A0ABR3DDF3_NEUIN
MTRRSRITNVSFMAVLVVALWPLEILNSFIWFKVTHATNNQGTKSQGSQPAQQQQQAAPPPPPYEAGVAAVAAV